MGLRGHYSLHVPRPSKFRGDENTRGARQPLSNLCLHDLRSTGVASITTNTNTMFLTHASLQPYLHASSYQSTENLCTHRRKGKTRQDNHPCKDLLPVRVVGLLVSVRYSQAFHIPCPTKHAGHQSTRRVRQPLRNDCLRNLSSVWQGPVIGVEMQEKYHRNRIQNARGTR